MDDQDYAEIALDEYIDRMADMEQDGEPDLNRVPWTVGVVS